MLAAVNAGLLFVECDGEGCLYRPTCLLPSGLELKGYNLGRVSWDWPEVPRDLLAVAEHNSIPHPILPLSSEI